MNGNGYGADTKLSVAPFTKEQRQRLEALTGARALRPSGSANDLIDMAAFIFDRSFVFRGGDGELA